MRMPDASRVPVLLAFHGWACAVVGCALADATHPIDEVGPPHRITSAKQGAPVT